MSSGLRELKLWQEAVALAGEVIRAARQAGRREVSGVTTRLMLAACGVAEAVADAHGRYDPLDQQRAYRAARRALLVLETLIGVARHAELLSAPVTAQLNGRTTAVARLLAGYLAFLERQIAAEEAARPAAAADVPRPRTAPDVAPVEIGPAVHIEP